MQTSLAELLHAVAADGGAIFLIGDDGNHGERAYSMGDAAERVLEPEVFLLDSNTLVRDAARRRELIVVGSDRAPRLSIGVPMLAGNRAIGVVTLLFAEPRIVNDDEREFLLTAGRHTAQALDRARLYEAADRARNEAEAFKVQADAELRERQKVEEALRLSETRYRGLAARTNRLYELSAALSEAVTIDDVAKVIVRHGKMVVGASAASVAMLAAGGSRFETLYAEGYPAALIESRRGFGADRGLCSTAAVETRRPVCVGSFAELQQKYPKSAALAADGGYASAAMLPLVTEGSVFGVMSFHFTVPVNFDAEYKALLTSVAQHCAQALDRARLYETAERARATAEAANQSKDDFLSTISHELRTPLNAILGWAAMLRDGSIDPDRSQRAVEAIFNNATRQGRLIEELLDVSRIVAGRASLDLHDVDLGENIRGAVEAMMPQAAAKGVELRYDAVDRRLRCRRPAPPGTSVPEPALERREVHAVGRQRDDKRGGICRLRRGARVGYGRGHRRRLSAARVRAVPSGRQHDDTRRRRAGAGPLHRAAARRGTRRHDSRRERRRRTRRDVCGDAAGDKSRGCRSPRTPQRGRRNRPSRSKRCRYSTASACCSSTMNPMPER